jgi:hypothetical protein
MVTIVSLWLPILVSAVIVFVVSSIIHMVLGYHKNDFIRVPDEGKARDAFGPLNIPPGDYVIPYAGTTKEMASPEFADKRDTGPVLFMTVLKPGKQSMAGSMVAWFLYSVLVGIFAAYIATRNLAPGADYRAVFRLVGTVAFMGYSLALLQNSIWYKRKWSSTLKSMLDGFIYALMTAGAFGWLWPAM